MNIHPDKPDKSYYLDIWKEMLGELLGWSESRVMEWAAGWSEFMDDPDDIFYHETPQYWAANLLIPEALKIKLSGREIAYLRCRIIEVFKDEHHFDFPRGTNWKPYKTKIQEVISRYEQQQSM